MKNNNLDKLKKEYMDIQIPDELDFLVKKALKDSGVDISRRKRTGLQKSAIAVASLAASLVLLTIGVNTSQAFAESLSKVPVVGSIVKLVTFREYKVDNKNYNADIKVPAIKGLENKELESSLNEKYLAENKKLYEQFMKDIKELEKNGEAHMGVSSGYQVMTDNDTIFSVKRYMLTTAGSSYTELKYDTIDKKKQVLITLPSLFKDESYVDIISGNILSQMREQMKGDEGMIYWIDEQVEDGLTEAFERINKDQGFYINPQGKLVISFDKYSVAPGYMGNPEFIIPTEEISAILVGSEYIK